MSVGISRQSNFLASNILFADFSFGNFYLNGVVFDSYRKHKALSLMGIKDRMSFINFVTSISHIGHSHHLVNVSNILNTIDSDFSYFFESLKPTNVPIKFLLQSFVNKRQTKKKKKIQSLSNNLNIMRISKYTKFSFNSKSYIDFINDNSSLLFNENFDLVDESSKETDPAHDIPQKRQKFLETKINNVLTQTQSIEFSHDLGEPNYVYSFSDVTPNLKLKKYGLKTFLCLENTKFYFTRFKITDALNLIVKPDSFILKLYFTDFNNYYDKISNHSILNNIFTDLIFRLNLRQLSKSKYNSDTNLIPSRHFNYSIFKKVSGSHADGIFTLSSVP